MKLTSFQIAGGPPTMAGTDRLLKSNSLTRNGGLTGRNINGFIAVNPV